MAATRLFAHDLATQPAVCRMIEEQRQCRKELICRSTYLAGAGGDLDGSAQCLEDVVLVDAKIDNLLASLRTSKCVQQNAKTQRIQVQPRARSRAMSVVRDLDKAIKKQDDASASTAL